MVKAMPGYWDLDRCAWVVPESAAATLAARVGAAPDAETVLPEQREETTSAPRTAPIPTSVPTTAPQYRPA